MDTISVQRIGLLHPKLRSEALVILAEVEKALTGKARCRIVSTLRTFTEQTALYAQGRTTKGNKVTNAKAGQSNHNYGLAIDFALIVDSDNDGKFESTSWNTEKDYDNDRKADWAEVVEIFKRHGWKWGGNWISFKDMPHFEKMFGYTVNQLLSLYNKGKVDKQGYVII